MYDTKFTSVLFKVSGHIYSLVSIPVKAPVYICNFNLFLCNGSYTLPFSHHLCCHLFYILFNSSYINLPKRGYLPFLQVDVMKIFLFNVYTLDVKSTAGTLLFCDLNKFKKEQSK